MTMGRDDELRARQRWVCRSTAHDAFLTTSYKEYSRFPRRWLRMGLVRKEVEQSSSAELRTKTYIRLTGLDGSSSHTQLQILTHVNMSSSDNRSQAAIDR